MAGLRNILMADVVKSSAMKLPAKGAKALLKIVADINKAEKKIILSPLTVTLGDEFQGVVKNVNAGVMIMMRIEEMLIEAGLPFRLRFVFNRGKIDTAINPEVSYGMLGQGLTATRKLMDSQKSSRKRFLIFDGGQKGDLEFFQDIFMLYQSITDEWKQKDYKIIDAFLKYQDYKTVAQKTGKAESQMWKKNISLRMPEYFAIKRIIKKYVY
jgi:SatD family (SatD)